MRCGLVRVQVTSFRKHNEHNKQMLKEANISCAFNVPNESIKDPTVKFSDHCSPKAHFPKCDCETYPNTKQTKKTESMN